jgi:hypothetical protein
MDAVEMAAVVAAIDWIVAVLAVIVVAMTVVVLTRVFKF